LNKIDRIHLFDVSRLGVIGRFPPRRDSMFILFLVSLLINLAAWVARGWADN
jgi:hypothetical protein